MEWGFDKTPKLPLPPLCVSTVASSCCCCYFFFFFFFFGLSMCFFKIKPWVLVLICFLLNKNKWWLSPLIQNIYSVMKNYFFICIFQKNYFLFYVIGAYKNKFIQITFSIFSFFFSIKQMILPFLQFSILPTKHHEKKLNLFYLSIFSSPEPNKP